MIDPYLPCYSQSHTPTRQDGAILTTNPTHRTVTVLSPCNGTSRRRSDAQLYRTPCVEFIWTLPRNTNTNKTKGQCCHQQHYTVQRTMVRRSQHRRNKITHPFRNIRLQGHVRRDIGQTMAGGGRHY